MENNSKAYFALGRYKQQGYFLVEKLAKDMGLNDNVVIGLEFYSIVELQELIPQAQQRGLIHASLLTLERMVIQSQSKTLKSSSTFPVIYAQTANPKIQETLESLEFFEIPVLIAT